MKFLVCWSVNRAALQINDTVLKTSAAGPETVNHSSKIRQLVLNVRNSSISRRKRHGYFWRETLTEQWVHHLEEPGGGCIKRRSVVPINDG